MPDRTQEEKVVEHMARAYGQQEWFYPPDFMQGGSLFVGYEASARLSELAKSYPEMIESRRRGKYMERRVRYENINEWWLILPSNLKKSFEDKNIGPKADFTV